MKSSREAASKEMANSLLKDIHTEQQKDGGKFLNFVLWI